MRAKAQMKTWRGGHAGKTWARHGDVGAKGQETDVSTGCSVAATRRSGQDVGMSGPREARRCQTEWWGCTVSGWLCGVACAHGGGVVEDIILGFDSLFSLLD